jgi:hypothetical protein
LFAGRVVKLRVRVIKLTAGVRVHVSMDGVMVKMVEGQGHPHCVHSCARRERLGVR